MTAPHKIDWLIDCNLPRTEIGGQTKKIQFPYPPEIGVGYSEHIELFDDIKIIRSTHKFNKEECPEQICLGKFQADFPSVHFVTQIMHKGCLEYKSAKGYSKRALGTDFFSRVQSFEIEQTLFTQEDISYSIVPLPESTLSKLLEPENAQRLYENLNLSKVDDFSEIKVPETITKKIESCAPDHLEGKMRALYGHSTILQYLVELNLYTLSTKEFLNYLSADIFIAEALHADLLQITADIPTISSLAQKYNVSPAKLNQSFLRKYNQTIYSFLCEQRLEQAYQALTNTEVPMKVLAHKIGYSHPNHFIFAFKKKYGVTPGSIRKELKKMDSADAT